MRKHQSEKLAFKGRQLWPQAKWQVPATHVKSLCIGYILPDAKPCPRQRSLSVDEWYP